MTQGYSSTRTTIFKKIIVLKTKQKTKIQKLRQHLRDLEKTKISTSELPKLPKNRINQIQERQKKIICNMMMETTGVKQILTELSSLQSQYLKLSV